jgi:hypothetical protein
LLLLAVVGATTTAFLLVFYRDGVKSAAWTLVVFGLVIALITGVIVWQLRLADRVAALEAEVRAERGRADKADAAAKVAAEKVAAVLAHAEPELIAKLEDSHPTLFAP